MTNLTITEKAIEMTILDAIEKGHTKANELASYIKSKTFEKSVKNYKRMLERAF